MEAGELVFLLSDVSGPARLDNENTCKAWISVVEYHVK